MRIDPNSSEFDNPRTKESVVDKRSIVYDQCLYIIACFSEEIVLYNCGCLSS